MKVAHFNTYSDGGSAVLMRRLHEALLGRGVSSHMYFRQGHILSPDATRLEFNRGLTDRLRERVKGKLECWLSEKSSTYFTTFRAPTNTRLSEAERDADVFHLHWVLRWLDLRSFLESLPPGAPVVWTVHDFGPLTGGCFMYSGCHQFEQQCQRCPILRAPFNRFIARWEWCRRRRALRGKRLYIVGNSQWTTAMASRASLFRDAVSFTTIPPGLCLDQFQARDKATAKQMLGIDPDRFVLGFGCAALTDPKKGLEAFLDLVQLLSTQISLDVLVFGEGLSGGELRGVKLHSLGRIGSPELLSLVYSAMDVYTMTSEMETFGQVAIEAQACGTPVCAFAVGGVPDAISDGRTGFLAPCGDIGGLAARILSVARDKPRREEMGRVARSWVSFSFSIEQVADAYVRLYEQALDEASWKGIQGGVPHFATASNGAGIE
jgi:glycosyltransferase involved in cell wall biosynthesis